MLLLANLMGKFVRKCKKMKLTLAYHNGVCYNLYRFGTEVAVKLAHLLQRHFFVEVAHT